MHNAPSVSYPAGRSRWAAALLLLVWLLGGGAAVLWSWESPDPWRMALMLGLLIAAGSTAAVGWRRSPAGMLSWDGEAWSWSAQPGAAAAGLAVGLDLQRALLVRWEAGGSSHWMWLERAARAERWDDLRRAVYSRARPHALPAAAPPAATP